MNTDMAKNKQASKEDGHSSMSGTAPLAKEQDGLTWRDYALVGERSDPSTWQLPHHTAVPGGKGGGEETVDWRLAEIAVAMLSRMGYRGVRVYASENEKIDAARHLAGHYRTAGKPLPNALAILV